MTEGPDTPSMGNDSPAGGNPPPAPPPSQPQGAPPPPAPQAGTGVGQPADLMTRFLAKLIDWIIVGIVIGVIIIPLTIGLAFSGAGGGFGMGGFSMGGILTNLVTTALVIAYFVFLESNRGQTVGKMLLKLKVQGPGGQLPTMEQAAKRNAYMLLGIVPILGGLAYLVAVIYIAVTINNNTTTRQGWHDEFADGTSVIKIG
jgi:uncharacterized RDD family membrane protein YckC